MGRQPPRSGTLIADTAPEIDGLRVEVGGTNFAEFEEPSSEVIGLAFAVVILIIAFGSVMAMGLPVAVALAGISVGTTLLLLSTNFLAVPDFAQFLGLMIGLGVGIDYALFIVTRYRENLHHGHTVAGVDRHRDRHRRPGRHLRGCHGGDLLPRDARHGCRVRLGPRHLRGLGGRHHGGRVAHVAPRPPRVRRRAGRGDALAGAHRLRPGGRRAARHRPRRPGDRAARPSSWRRS